MNNEEDSMNRTAMGIYYRAMYYPRFKGWSYEFLPCGSSGVTLHLVTSNKDFSFPLVTYSNKDFTND